MTPVQTIAKAAVTRFEAQGLKGKARDRAALEFVIGAANALQLIHDYHGLTGLALIVSVRGYAELEQIAKEAE